MGLMGGGGSVGISKVMIFIDGGYLRKKVSEISDGNIDYNRLAMILTKNTARSGVKPQLMRVNYYDAIPNLKDVEKMPDEPDPDNAFQEIQVILENQEKYLEKIRMLDLFDVRLGKLSWNAKGETRQKGVDSLIAIDMITKAYQNQYDEAVLVAGDTDFLEIVKAVKSIGPQVTGAYFENNTSHDLIYEFDKRQPLRKDELIANKIINE